MGRRPLLLLSLLLLAGPLTARDAASDPVELRRQAEAAWSRRKTSAEPWLLMGRALYAEGRRGKALGFFDRALKRDPHAADAYYWRGRVYEDKKKLDEAANEYQAALKADPGHAAARDAWKNLSDRVAVDGAK